MNPKIVFDEVNERIVTEDDTKNIIYTEQFEKRLFPTFRDVVTLWNDNAHLQEIDDFLATDERCTQEEREEIIESFWNTFNKKQ